MEVFQDYAYYYNAFYKDKDYAAEGRQIDVLVKRYGSGIKKDHQLWLWYGKTRY